MSMEGWAKCLNSLFEFNGDKLLIDSSKVSAEQIKLRAETEYKKL